MADVRIVEGGQNNAPISAANIHVGARGNALKVALTNASGDVYNAGGGSAGSGGDGAINDGADSNIKASVKNTGGAKPLHVIITNVSGDTPNLPSSNPDGSIVDGVSASIKATVKDFANANPLAVTLVNASGDVYNASGGSGSGGDGAINDGANSTIKATVLNDASQIPTASDKGLVIAFADKPTREVGRVRQAGAWATSVTGDVSTVPKAGETWPVSIAATVNTREQAKIGVHVAAGSIGISGDVNVTSTDLDIRDLAQATDSVGAHQKGAWRMSVSGDVSTTPKAGETWPVSITGTLNVTEQNKTGVYVTSGLVGVTGDRSITDGADSTIKGTVRDYANSNPVAVVLTNASGDTYNPVPKAPVLITIAGRVANAGSNSIVSAVTGKKIKVVSYDLQGDGDNARAYFASGASGTQLTPEWELASREGVAKQLTSVGGGYILATVASAALSLECSSSRGIKYAVTYHAEDAL